MPAPLNILRWWRLETPHVTFRVVLEIGREEGGASSFVKRFAIGAWEGSILHVPRNITSSDTWRGSSSRSMRLVPVEKNLEEGGRALAPPNPP